MKDIFHVCIASVGQCSTEVFLDSTCYARGLFSNPVHGDGESIRTFWKNNENTVVCKLSYLLFI